MYFTCCQCFHYATVWLSVQKVSFSVTFICKNYSMHNYNKEYYIHHITYIHHDIAITLENMELFLQMYMSSAYLTIQTIKILFKFPFSIL